MAEDGTAHSRSGRTRPWHVVVALLCTLLIVFGALRVARRVRLQQRIEAVRAAGYPVTSAERDAWYPMPTSGENAADYVMQAITSLHIPQGQEMKQVPLVGSRSQLSRTQPLDEPTRSAIGKLLDDNAKALDLLRQAVLIEHCRYDRMFTAHMAEFDDGVVLICLKAILHAEQNEPGPAVDATIWAYRLANSIAQEPVVIFQVLRQACQLRATTTLECILSRTSMDAGHLEHLEQTLAAAYEPNAMERAFVGERCHMLSSFRWPTVLSWAPSSKDLSPLGLRIARASGALDLAQIRYMDLLDKHLAAIRLPVYQRAQAAEEIRNECRRLHDRQVFLNKTLPDYADTIMPDAASVARFLTARTALAVERYRLATGQLPDRLVDLVPTYLEQAPQDPFDGQVLRYERLRKGYILYSVGIDRIDDGGAGQDPAQRGLLEPLIPGRDITFTVER